MRERVNAEGGSELAYTTVMTVLARLHEKGLVDRMKEGRGFVYSPRHSEPELIAVLSRRAVDRVVDRYGDAAPSAFVGRLEDTDPELLDGVRRLAGGSL